MSTKEVIVVQQFTELEQYPQFVKQPTLPYYRQKDKKTYQNRKMIKLVEVEKKRK